MDFQSLSRKELQILCKKNKIPANITNVAMADALAALTKVEGMEEIGNTQSVLKTPCTRIKNPVVSIETEPNVSITRTRRGTRKTNNQDEEKEDLARTDMLKTPAATRTSRRRATDGASVSKKIEPHEGKEDPKEKEKIEPQEEKEDLKEKDTTHVYATRRSTRLVSTKKRSEPGPEMGKGKTQAIKISALSEEESDDLSKKPLLDAIEDDKSTSVDVPEHAVTSDLANHHVTTEETPHAAEVQVEFEDLAVENSTAEDNSNLGSGELGCGDSLGVVVAIKDLLEEKSSLDNALISEDVSAIDVSADGIKDLAEEPNSFEREESFFGDSRVFQGLVLEDATSDTMMPAFVQVLESVPEKTNNSKDDEFVADEANIVSGDTFKVDADEVPILVDGENVSHVEVSSEMVAGATDLPVDKSTTEDNSSLESEELPFGDSKAYQDDPISVDGSDSVSVEILGGATDIGQGEEFVANGDNVMSGDACNAEADQVDASNINSTTEDSSRLESEEPAVFGGSKANQEDPISVDGSEIMVSVSVEGEEFIANGDNVTSGDACSAEAGLVLVPLDDASNDNVDQVLIPDTSNVDVNHVCTHVDDASNVDDDHLLIPTEASPDNVMSGDACSAEASKVLVPLDDASNDDVNADQVPIPDASNADINNVMTGDACNAKEDQVLVPFDDASKADADHVWTHVDDDSNVVDDQLLIPAGAPVSAIFSEAPVHITAKEDVLSFTCADIDASVDKDQDQEGDQGLDEVNTLDLGLTSELSYPMQSKVDEYSLPPKGLRVSKMEDCNSEAALDNSLLFRKVESSGNSDKKCPEQGCKNQEAVGPVLENEKDVADLLENVTSDRELGILKMKAGSSVEVEVEIEKFDNQKFSTEYLSSPKVDFDANVSIEGTLRETPVTCSVTKSRHLLTPRSSSKKMAIEVLDEDKLVASEEKGNKESNTSAAMSLSSKTRLNLVVAKEKENDICKGEDSTEKALRNTSIRKLKKMLVTVPVEEKDKATSTTKIATSMSVLDENKENNTNASSGGMSLRNKSRLNLVVVAEEEKEKNDEKCENKALKNTSLRQLKKMFKQKLVVVGDNGSKSILAKEQMQLEKTRPALQSLTNNCWVQGREN